MSKLKRTLLVVMVLVMSVAATSTVFARGFGGGRMMQVQNRQIVCQIAKDGICMAYNEDICPVWGHTPGQGRHDRGFRGCRRLQQ